MRPALTLIIVAGCSFSANLAVNNDALTDGGIDGARVQPPLGACGRPGAIADDFADGVVAPWWVASDGGNAVEQAGTLAVTPRSTAGDRFTGYRANPYVDLRDAAAEVEVRTMLARGSGATAQFRFDHGASTFGISVTDGVLAMGMPGALFTTTYDPVAHRHWRISHASTGDQLAFAVSADGAAWTTLHGANAPAWISAASLALGATNPASVASPGTVTFAELSTYVAPSLWCTAETLSDDFNGDSTIGIVWAYHGRTSSGCAETESASAAHVDQNGTAACGAHYAASTLYSLEGSEVVVRITAIGTFTQGWITYLGLWTLEGQFIRLYFDEDQMCADGTGVTRTCTSYDGARDLWRIREVGGTVYFETAASTNNQFTAVHTVASPFPLTAVRPYFGTATDRAIGQSIGLSVDRFN